MMHARIVPGAAPVSAVKNTRKALSTAKRVLRPTGARASSALTTPAIMLRCRPETVRMCAVPVRRMAAAVSLSRPDRSPSMMP